MLISLHELQYGSLRRYSKARVEYLKTLDPNFDRFLMVADGSVVERHDSSDRKIMNYVKFLEYVEQYAKFYGEGYAVSELSDQWIVTFNSYEVVSLVSRFEKMA
jgi:hypothetical protein